ncbi:uncharacterized protein RJT20DRAFT_130466 [Scheffersomyces xylosifermentans]|uniref:uncharacterized protein n=1 Tax=Scheffersomyces xylosifermentans TaxID=1304137 RepID=UPI00315DCC05
MSMTRKFLNISSYKTASRCWIPIQSHNLRQFSSKQRCVNFNNLSETNLVSNDDILSTTGSTMVSAIASEVEYETFEPTIHSSEEVLTAAPVNKA